VAYCVDGVSNVVTEDLLAVFALEQVVSIVGILTLKTSSNRSLLQTTMSTGVLEKVSTQQPLGCSFGYLSSP
jgi:hypothetical protein